MSDAYSVYWDGAKKELENYLSETDMKIWISRIEYAKFNNNVMFFSVPSNFIKDNILKFKDTIESTISRISGYNCKIEFIIKKDSPINSSNSSQLPEKINSEEYNNNEENNNKEKHQIQSINNDEFTFDNFIISSSNELAAHTAKAVAEEPGSKYNPYFVWGGSGVGKTHLLKAIQNYIKEHYPSKKVKYSTSEEFTNDFVNALRGYTMEQFRIKYRQLDVLLIDDVQFFSGKENIQVEFFHTFDKLYNSKKQLVFSCDQPINKVKKIEDRLRSRFGMGITVDLKQPDYELRMAVLKNMMEAYSLSIKDDAIDYICSNITNSIRDIKGAFMDLLAYASILKIDVITKDFAIQRLKEKIISNINSKPISIDKIIQIVGEYYNLKTQEIVGNKRTKSIAIARQIAMYLSRKLTRLSTTQIGSYFGDKEHATVMHAAKKIEQLIEKDYKIKKDVEILISNIQLN